MIKDEVYREIVRARARYARFAYGLSTARAMETAEASTSFALEGLFYMFPGKHVFFADTDQQVQEAAYEIIKSRGPA